MLWDIDNTLLYTGGAGGVAMTRAFRELYGVDDAFGRVEFSGRSDTAIFIDAARTHAIAQDPALEIVRFIDAYLPHMEAALREIRGALMPGIDAVLATLSERPDVTQGLGTGNFRRTGEAKLVHYGIAHYFPGTVGGFGDDHESRDELVRIGIERLRNGGSGDERVVVIGDTPHDVAAAKANGAFALGVATGRDSVQRLHGCGADAAVEDLSDTDAALHLILGA
ncbi:MAG: haloacid dehalogenase-like hydrolase [Chloroflexi bacterium]|nr:haloacid dehalogenase-like hydrolase [Chloroflexota bacterium]